MDEVGSYNNERWQRLGAANALFTRPVLDLTPEAARECVDAEGLLGNVDGKDVLCLAGGGGQQSAAFALLGAKVVVFDLSAAQLERDRQAAQHYNVTLQTVQGDMRDLSSLAPNTFDIVYQPYSLTFVPNARVVFEQITRILRPGGIYFVVLSNPFTCGLTQADWNGNGYTLRLPYIDSAEITTPDPEWVYMRNTAQNMPLIPPSREYRQTLSKTLNNLIGLGFTLLHVSDSKDMYPDPQAEPGTWDHLVSFAPPWLVFWLRYQPIIDPRNTQLDP